MAKKIKLRKISKKQNLSIAREKKEANTSVAEIKNENKKNEERIANVSNFRTIMGKCYSVIKYCSAGALSATKNVAINLILSPLIANIGKKALKILLLKLGTSSIFGFTFLNACDSVMPQYIKLLSYFGFSGLHMLNGKGIKSTAMAILAYLENINYFNY